MINATNVLPEGKAHWPSLNLAETRLRHIRVRGPVTVLPSVRRFLAGIPRAAGTCLFAAGDTEAGWRGWRVIELRGGLARRYRDVRFERSAEWVEIAYANLTRPHTDRFYSRVRRCRFDRWTEQRGLHRTECGHGGMEHRRYDSL